MLKNVHIILSLFFIFLAGCGIEMRNQDRVLNDQFIELSGIYPHLAFYNEDAECGTGAVVSWADRLWAVTYGPHSPYGSADKLYEIDTDLKVVIHQESQGGTPANRMIHKESNQLFIGPYAIGNDRTVRAIPYDQMPGRPTGNARHLSDPEGKIYYASMEEGFYEVDVNTLKVTTLYPDAHELPEEEYGKLLPGAHGKGFYSGQGVLVYANNGENRPEALTQFDLESGALVEWDGTTWSTIRRNQFVEVTGPGGILGNQDPVGDPIWTTGWDHKSLLVGVRDALSDSWSFYRFPKASHSYDGAHGWNTEWPRIRNVGTQQQPDYLMTMHGMFWNFPGSFSLQNSGGIRPRSAYLKVIGDFTRWNGKLVMACDDSAKREFLNKRKVKGNIEGPGQSNSNLWFMDPLTPDMLGPATAEGGVWLVEAVKAGVPSEPFLFSGWPERSCWIQHESRQPVAFVFEVDLDGNGNWSMLKEVTVEAKNSLLVEFSDDETGEWIRVTPEKSTQATLHFCYNDKDSRSVLPDPIFEGLAHSDHEYALGGLLYGLGNNRRALGIAATRFNGEDQLPQGYYELDEKLQLNAVDDSKTDHFIREKFAIPKDVIKIDKSSVLILDDQGRRWRLPLGNKALTSLTNNALLRISREVATERDLFSCQGTFYELPAENADGFAKIRPISSHAFRIHDYASYRGMLVMTGIDPEWNGNNPHIIVSKDGSAAVWAGVIDDLWKLGKPTGHGGPWKRTKVDPGEISDPYLIGFYDERTLELSHQSDEPVTFRIEVEPVGHGPWMLYQTVSIAPGETYEHRFPDHFQSRWIRFSADKATTATAWLEYK